MSFVSHFYGTAAVLAARNPLVPKGGVAAESDTGVVKIGDGVTRYNSLSAALSSNYAQRKPRSGASPGMGAGIARRLKDKSAAAVIGIVGDSTSDGTAEWFELLIQWLASQSAMTTKVMRWSDTAQGYGIPVFLATGSEASVTFAASGNYITVPDSTQNSITGDIAGAVDCALTSWVSSTNNPALLTKFGASGQRSFRFYVEQTTGLLVLAWYADGTNAKTVKSSVAPTVSAGGRLQVGFELDVDDGASSHAVKFYTAAAGSSTWTQLGTTQVAAGGGTTSVFDSTTQLAVGSRTDSSVDQWGGTLYSAHFLSGLLNTGAVVAGYDPGLYPAQQGTQALIGVTGETWSPVGTPTITYAPIILAYNGSFSGKALAYSADTTRIALQTPRQPDLFYINYGHNETAGVLSTWDAFAVQFAARWSLSDVVAVAQNPQTSPRTATQIARQSQIASEVMLIAARRNLGLLNAYDTIAADTATYLVNDGVHPNAAGSAAWAAEAEEMFLPWPTV